MSKILQRLRCGAGQYIEESTNDLLNDAADEIERLNKIISHLEKNAFRYKGLKEKGFLNKIVGTDVDAEIDKLLENPTQTRV